jgi:hypothetical protein
MQRAQKLLAILCLGSISPLSTAASNIDVMLVFSDDTNLSSIEKTVVAARYQTVLSLVYNNQLEGNRTVEVWPLLIPEMSYTATGKSSLQALSWMKTENNKVLPPSPLRAAREALGNPGADVILMVVPPTTDVSDCGRAGPDTIPLTVNTNRSEDSAFAIVATSPRLQ